MSEKITGIIESREVADIEGKGQYSGQISQKISLKINGLKYTTFSNSVPAEVAERLEHIKQGDEVELSFTEKPGTWQGKQVTYRNITDIIKVTRTGESQFGVSEVPATLAPNYQGPTKDGKPVDSIPNSRDDMMRLSYSKDTINAIMTRGHLSPAGGESEELFIARVFSLIKAGAKTLGE
jgi:hypothetical protein